MTSLGTQAEARPSGSFVGRERELAELLAGLADVTADHGHLFLLSGEPGIGKTRLADEFGRLALAQGVRVAWGRCWEGGGAPAYWPWIQLLRACLTGTDAEQRAAILSAEATPQVVQDVAQLLPELRAAHPSLRPPGPQPTDPEQARFQLFQSVAALLRNVARIGPLVIVIDDLHDADHSSLWLFRFIAGHSKDARILLVGTYRNTEVKQSPELGRLVGDLSREGNSLPIVGLSEAEVGEFVANSSGRTADERLVADLYQATDGNPLFVDGVVRLLVAEGKLDRAVGGDAFKIPDGVQESIRRRIVKLPEEANQMLSIASVIGNQFEAQVLAEVSGSATGEIVERMESALRAGIVIDAGGDTYYRFSHTLVREALYQDLPGKRRNQLHAEIGQAIESVHQRNLEPHIAALANHYRMAGVVADAEKAIDYSIRAGSAAFAGFAYEEAGAHWRAALEMMDELGGGDRKRRADLLWLLGAGEGLVSSGAKALEYLEEAAPLFEELGDSKAAHEVHLKLAGFRSNNTFGLMDVRRAMAHFKKAEAFLAGQSDSHHHVSFYLAMAGACYSTGRIGDGLAAAKRAMEICERLDPEEPANLRLSGDGRSAQSEWRIGRFLDAYWSWAATFSSQFLVYSGSVTEGLRLADQARRRTDTIEHTATGSTIALFGAGNHILLRNPREAQEWCKSELAKPRTANVVYRRVRENATPRDQTTPIAVHQTLVWATALTGELTQARAYLAEAEGVNRPSNLSFLEGEWELAAKMLTAELQQSSTAGHRMNEVFKARDLAWFNRFAGERVQAVQLLQRALEICVDGGMTLFELAIRSSLATMAADGGDVAEALPHLQRCREIVGAGENWFGRAGDVQRAEAVVAAAQGEYSAAEAHFEKAIATFQRYCAPWEEADTLQYWGRALLAAGERTRAIEKFDAAIEVYRSRGAGTRFVEYVMADKMRAQPVLAEQSGRAGAGTSGRESVFRNEGDFWTIAYLEHSFRLRDMRGLHYIAHLLARPSERFHVRELSASVGGDALSSASSDPSLQVDREDAPPVLDSKAKADYRAHRSELRADLEEAERMNDTGRAERIREELEFVNDELSAAVGLSGRDRKMSDPSERTRVRIRKAIRSALSAIREHDPSLAHHLTTCIRTGYYCVYLPDPRQLLSWKL